MILTEIKMFENIVNTIGFEKLLIIVVVLIPFVFLILVELLLIRKDLKNLNIKTFLLSNKITITAILVSTIILGAIIISVSYYESEPKILSSSPGTGENWSNYDKPLEVVFNVPVDISSIDPRMTPKLEGDWVWDKFLFSNYTVRGHFYPKQTYLPDQRIVIYIIGARRLFINGENHELALNFFSPKPPEVLSTTPKDQETSFPREDAIKVLLNKSNLYLTNWTYSMEPNIELELANQFSSVLELKPKTALDADTQYKITLNRTSIQYDVENKAVLDQAEAPDYTYSFTFKTLKEPFVEEFAPQGTGIHEDAAIAVKFTLPMNQQSVESHFSIDPKIEGTFKWADMNSFTYTPKDKLPKGTKYNIKFEKGIESIDQGPTYRDLNYSFETVGAIKISAIDPANANNRVAENSPIRVSFDQEVDKVSAQNSFEITPGVAGSFSWDNNTLVYSPNAPLSFNQTFTVTLHKNMSAIYGQPLAEDYTFSFTVRGQEVIIGGIPQIYQPYGSFSCNVYAGIMGLAYKGYNLNASQLISETGYNPNQVNGNWAGNPYKEYVGNADGSWGYGIYWTALQEPFNNRGINTQIIQGWNKYSLAATIINGNPVIIWRYNGESSNYDKDWTAADGTYIHGINGQHGGIVIGVRGSTTNPEAFLVNDPWYGQTWYDADYVDYTWSRMNRTAMVIY